MVTKYKKFVTALRRKLSYVRTTKTIMEPRITLEELPPEFYGLMRNVENYLKKCGLPHSLLLLVKTRASQINKCGFCLDMHHKDAIINGETFQRLYLLPAWKESPVFTASEKAALNLTDTLTKIATVDLRDIEEAYSEAAKYFSKEEIANLIMTINQINSWNRFMISFGAMPGSYKPEVSWEHQPVDASLQ
jgi:AhpD family alkylhydroperoxidase